MRKFIKIFDILLSVVCAFIFAFVALGEHFLPDSIITYDNSFSDFSSVFRMESVSKVSTVNYKNGYSKSTVKLMGIIPVKDVRVTDKPSQKVYVSGEAFGIKLYTDGVIVVGTKSVKADSGEINPAEKAGIRVGDVIVSINSVNVYSASDVSDILNSNNSQPYEIKIKRDGRYKTFTLVPVYSSREGCYKAGMWVRDSTAGIGTITFYNKSNGIFAALGHQINDVDTNEIMPLLEGEAVGATVTGVETADNNNAGSLECRFEDKTIGKLTENSKYGVYGSYVSISDNAKEYTVASAQDVHKGSAQIIATIDNSAPKAYDIQITKVNYNGSGEKDITFKVTDEELRKKTGGIVQGMSGSPIIQDGKLAGAVTHVIVDNARKGYGIFAQTMLEESNGF